MQSFFDWKIHYDENDPSLDMCSSTSALERILVKSLVKSGSGDSWLRWCRVFGDASLWILSKRMRNQEVICELLGYNNTTTTSKIDRKANHGSVRIEWSSGTIPSVNCSWNIFLSDQTDRNERLETYSDRNINVTLKSHIILFTISDDAISKLCFFPYITPKSKVSKDRLFKRTIPLYMILYVQQVYLYMRKCSEYARMIEQHKSKKTCVRKCHNALNNWRRK